MLCLCQGISKCNVTRGCQDEYCGPFFLSKIYWADAGKVTFPEDSPKRANAFEDCANDYYCSARIVKNYMIKFAQDCNNDNVVDCLDYAKIHLFGGNGCSKSITSVPWGAKFLKQYNECKLF